MAFEAGHDGFWLARWLAALGIEVHVIHSSSVAVTREHRRAKTDRLDTELLKRGFLGWLRGEHGHCKMVAVPTLAEEDAKRPSRERETLVGEASRIITRVKAAFVRLGIRSFNPKLKAAAERLGTLRTPEGEPIPPNTLAALKRDLERHQIVKKQIREIEQTRLEHLAQRRRRGRMPWCDCWPAWWASVLRRPTCWCRRCCRGTCGVGAPWHVMPVSPARPMKVGRNAERRDWPVRVTRAYGEA